MAKKIKNYTTKKEQSITVQEPALGYFAATLPTPKVKVTTKDFTYKDFKKVSSKVDFTLAEWADLLCISERTLQRYSKSNTAFNGLQIERILLLERMINDGRSLFGKNLVSWLKKPSFKYNGHTPFSMLSSFEGIQSVIDYIGQLEYGVLP
jgi:putative toxin-antitoxin system antitoxin component (TIGR02293 family)